MRIKKIPQPLIIQKQLEWFCETLLTNFMNICQNVGILQECKEKLINFIQEF